MLGLKLPTDPRWVNIVEKNIDQILIDHAWCEQKAATMAITLITRFPEYPDMVKEFTALAREEMEHFAMVHEKLTERGFKLEFEKKDAYVNDLRAYSKKGGSRQNQLVEALLVSAMIEARSCERFRLLSEQINDEDLRKFYRKQWPVKPATTPFSFALHANMAKALTWMHVGMSTWNSKVP